jgi:signal transduction histidine kinase
LNRAFIFLADEKKTKLTGTMAVGPISAEDAHRIWTELAQKGPSIDELLDSSVPSPSDMLLTARVRSLAIPLSDQKDPLAAAFHQGVAARVMESRSTPNLSPELIEQLGLEEFACVPLAVQDEPLGMMLADNKYSHTSIDQEDVELLELFSRQASLAISNARAYERIRDQLEELQRTRDRLIEAERMASVGRMASHLAHEIRNPLTAMGGFAAAIARQHHDDAKTHRNASIIYEEARRLERTLVNVLDYTRPLRPNKGPASLNAIVRETVDQFRPQLNEANISLRMALEEGLPQVQADAAMIKQVVINLLKNAVEAMESKQEGVLTVSTSLRQGGVQLTVADTGVGMEQDTLSKLFSPFFTTKIGGIGLGLSVSRRIIQQHGGGIQVESKLGDGSQFTVALTLAGAEEARVPASSGNRQQQEKG